MKTITNCLFVLVVLTASCASVGELEERKEIQSRVKDAFLQENFSELENLSDQFRKEKSRTSSGLWKLTLFNAGIGRGMTAASRESEEFWEKMESKANRWANAFPNSPSAHIAYSNALIRHAWFFRGNEYSYKVPSEAWEPFFRYIDLAGENLERYKRVASVDPRWYETMLTVARARNWEREKFDALLAEALQREPGFYQTYFLALEYLLPKWHGSLADIENFADDAVKKTQEEEGEGMYARIYWFASQTQFKNGLFESSAVVWPKMKAGFEDILKRYPDAWNLNNYARFACLAQDRATARELMKKIEGRILVEAWQPIALLGQCQHWLLSSTPDVALNSDVHESRPEWLHADSYRK